MSIDRSHGRITCAITFCSSKENRRTSSDPMVVVVFGASAQVCFVFRNKLFGETTSWYFPPLGFCRSMVPPFCLVWSMFMVSFVVSLCFTFGALPGAVLSAVFIVSLNRFSQLGDRDKLRVGVALVSEVLDPANTAAVEQAVATVQATRRLRQRVAREAARSQREVHEAANPTP